MFQRFAAGTAVASIVIAIASTIVSVMPGLKFERIYPITILWCCVPLFWGVWAVLPPSAWVPKRLPLWGSFLGLFAGSMGSLRPEPAFSVSGRTSANAIACNSSSGRSVALLLDVDAGARSFAQAGGSNVRVTICGHALHCSGEPFSSIRGGNISASNG
ncbi:MAG: hypothetical protein LAP86_29260 [Acidobacteriia bacterium]|nr:hypothetical protein [Terriglobia bacterium]